MQDGGGGAGAKGGGGGGNGMQQLLAILADGEEQARRLGELPLADGGGDYRGAARRLHCTLGRAVAVARAVEAASASTDRSSDSPRSADESSGRTATAAGDAQERQAGLLCKRRKGLPRWTAKFRVPDANLEATPDDGLSWRKYGQKDILGAKFPRGYYRCTYRNAQGCPATKQVQRSDADLCVFDVTYQGEHTCHQRHRHHGATPSTTTHSPQQEQEHPAAAPGMQHVAMGFKDVDVLKVETTSEAAARALHGHCHDGGAPSFCFPSVPFAHHAAGEAGPAEALISFSPSGSGYGFSAAAPPRSHCPCPVVVGGSYDDVYDSYARRQQAPPGAESSSELAEVVSRATAPAPAPASGFDYASLYQYHQAELDPHLPFPPFGGAGPSHGPYQ